ncbi:uncharacterized protein LOC126011873 [Suncus etruscus]|uniref:uncharacterized protein LOC126011873 n=1 Tax=Suncus etruscus TaxID=109475 RepID=UPI002110C7CB|nr:uncharacterized protein LOC126011873 [Suncus etruscus]
MLRESGRAAGGQGRSSRAWSLRTPPPSPEAPKPRSPGRALTPPSTRSLPLPRPALLRRPRARSPDASPIPRCTLIRPGRQAPPLSHPVPSSVPPHLSFTLTCTYGPPGPQELSPLAFAASLSKLCSPGPLSLASRYLPKEPQIDFWER